MKKLSKQEFQKAYHHYRRAKKEEVEQEAEKVNEIADGFKVVAVGFPGLGWCLMLEEAAGEILVMMRDAESRNE